MLISSPKCAARQRHSNLPRNKRWSRPRRATRGISRVFTFVGALVAAVVLQTSARRLSLVVGPARVSVAVTWRTSVQMCLTRVLGVEALEQSRIRQDLECFNTLNHLFEDLGI
jgi:hypothetical protein